MLTNADIIRINTLEWVLKIIAKLENSRDEGTRMLLGPGLVSNNH
jgi:hypothetical protein